jgi:hypothetical protein
MSSTNERTKGIWLIALLALPLLSAAAPEPLPPVLSDGVEWMAATHDVRLVMQAKRQKQDCLEREAEHSR